MNFSRENGAGRVGKGCVGDDCSPGTSLCGTGRSSIGQIGLPVTRSNTIQQAELRRLRDDVDRLAVGFTVSSFGPVTRS